MFATEHTFLPRIEDAMTIVTYDAPLEDHMLYT